MTTTENGLLRAICENPADDCLRLVYADWLDDQGEAERAEFIRLQIELENFPRCPRSHFSSDLQGGQCGPCQSKCGPLRFREQELLGFRICLRCDWHKPIQHGGWQWVFSRGFIDEVRCSLADWMQHGPAIVAAHPVTRVVLVDREPLASGDRLLWRWIAGNELPDQEYINGAIYAWLPRGERNRFEWPTRDAAHSALPIAAVNWARSAAGLPPLSPAAAG